MQTNFNKNLIFCSNQTTGDVKNEFFSTFVTSQQSKKVTANGHEKLNMLVIVQVS